MASRQSAAPVNALGGIPSGVGMVIRSNAVTVVRQAIKREGDFVSDNKKNIMISFSQRGPRANLIIQALMYYSIDECGGKHDGR
jgi:hypothetical protein